MIFTAKVLIVICYISRSFTDKQFTLGQWKKLPCHNKMVYFGIVKEAYFVIAKQFTLARWKKFTLSEWNSLLWHGERSLPCHSKTVYFGTVKETHLVIAKQAVRLLQGWGLGFSDSGLSHTHINGTITRAVWIVTVVLRNTTHMHTGIKAVALISDAFLLATVSNLISGWIGSYMTWCRIHIVCS